jgi:hypothetical protein
MDPPSHAFHRATVKRQPSDVKQHLRQPAPDAVLAQRRTPQRRITV